MGCGLYVVIVIIDDDHGWRWGHHCHHRQSMVVVAGWSSSNQHRLWSLSSLTSTVVIVVVGINCGHPRMGSPSTIMESRSIIAILLSLSEVMRLRASSLPSKAGVVIVRHRQQRNPGRGVRPMVVQRSSSSNWVKGLVVAEQVKCPVMGLINSNNMVKR